MITISQHQQPTTCVKAGRGQPRFDCGRQVFQLNQRSMGYRQAYFECWDKRKVDITKPWLQILHSPSTNKIYLWLLIQLWTFEQVVSWVQVSYIVMMESFKTSTPLRCVSFIVKLNSLLHWPTKNIFFKTRSIFLFILERNNILNTMLPSDFP